jgi:hypothetical protein
MRVEDPKKRRPRDGPFPSLSLLDNDLVVRETIPRQCLSWAVAQTGEHEQDESSPCRLQSVEDSAGLLQAGETSSRPVVAADRRDQDHDISSGHPIATHRFSKHLTNRGLFLGEGVRADSRSLARFEVLKGPLAPIQAEVTVSEVLTHALELLLVHIESALRNPALGRFQHRRADFLKRDEAARSRKPRRLPLDS